MVDLDDLRVDADKVARGRGHSLRWLRPWVKEYRSLQRAECDHDGCPASIVVDTHPLPGGTRIGGGALVYDCPVEGRRR